MEIRYTEEKCFTKEQVQELFLSVNWISGQYPSRLYKALLNSSTVITAWDGEKLVGLARVLDDSEMTAYMHYVLINPKYQGYHIAHTMIEMVKEKYKNGANQWGYKDRAEVKTYNNMIKSYQSCMKQINDLIINTYGTGEFDEFDEFNK